MSDTYGPSGEVLSPSACLQRFLESRLRALLAETGSPLYRLTWKHWDIGSSGQICALRASVPRTSASDSSLVPSGWGTPTAMEPGGTPEQHLARKRKAVANGARMGISVTALALQVQMVRSGWPAPTKSDARQRGRGAVARDAGFKNCQVIADHYLGPTLNGSPAATEKPGQLNPDFALWLMGLPPAWASCAPQAMPSSRKSRRRS